MTQPPQYGYAPPPPPMVFPGGYASWGSRAGALLLDFLLTVPFLVPLFVGYGVLLYGLVDRGGPHAAAVIVGALFTLVGMAGAIAVMTWNQVFRQGRTGQSWGKSKVGIIVLREVDGQPQGPGMSFVRYLLHAAINQACYIDYLWPLWDQKNQTLTDKVLSTVVVNSVQPGDQR